MNGRIPFSSVDGLWLTSPSPLRNQLVPVVSFRVGSLKELLPVALSLHGNLPPSISFREMPTFL